MKTKLTRAERRVLTVMAGEVVVYEEGRPTFSPLYGTCTGPWRRLGRGDVRARLVLRGLVEPVYGFPDVNGKVVRCGYRLSASGHAAL